MKIMVMSPNISVVVPVKNESGNIKNLINEIDLALLDFNYEIIYVNDGSDDSTQKELNNILKKHNKLRVIIHEYSKGQSAALRSGIYYSKGSIIATLDGDGQNDPSDLPPMIKLLKDYKNHDILIGGVREKRQDNMARLIASSFAKYCRFFLLQDTHPDSGCGIKVFYKDLYMKLPYFDHMHRFLSALTIREGSKVLEYKVKHRERVNGISNYTNFGRLLVGISDIIGVMWLKKRMPKNNSCKEIKK